MKALKYSRQGRSIKVCLTDRHDHSTANTLYASIREEFPDISLGTVYRDLNLLTETDEVQKLTYGDGAVHFDGGTRQHYHFVYSECDQVYDTELGTVEDLNKEAQEHAPGIIDNHYVLFYRRYGNCLQRRVDETIGKPAQTIYVDISSNYYY